MFLIQFILTPVSLQLKRPGTLRELWVFPKTKGLHREI